MPQRPTAGSLGGARWIIILSGHRNIKRDVFRYLLNLSQSDEVILYVGKKPYHYRVAQKALLRQRGMPLEVGRQNAQWIAPTDHGGSASSPLGPTLSIPTA
jgi:hypothetical protein